MANIVTSYSNFAKAKLDHSLNGRFDLPIYQSGADVFQNFISNYQGNAIFSSGFLSEVVFQDCAFVEFKFGITQNYLCVFYANNVQFLAYDTNGNFGWVLSGGVPLVVVSPYSLVDAKTISLKHSYAQNSDTMYIVHRSYQPYKLTRVAANNFTLLTYGRTSDPFASAVSDTSVTSNTISTGAKTFTVSAGKAYTPGASITLVSGVNSISGTVTSYSGTSLVVNITSIVGSGTFTSWVITQTANLPGAISFYGGKLYMASTNPKPTTVWCSNSGLYDDFTIQSPLTDASGFNFGIANITQQIEWLFPGDNSLIAGSTDGIVAVNGGSVGSSITPATVQATLTSAEPTNGSYPLKKEGLIFYIGFSSRNMYYFQYDILTQLFVSKDANLSSYDITKGGVGKIRYKKDRNDLIIGQRGDGALVSCNFKLAENIIGWHERTTPGINNDDFTDIAVISDNLGNPQLFALVNRSGTFYIELQAQYVEFSRQDDFFTGIEDVDKEAYNRFVGEQLRNCVYLDGSVQFSDLHVTTITYNPGAGTITASGASFSAGDVGKHIAYKTATGYESGRFKITAFTSTTVVSVTVLQQPVTYNKNGVQQALNVWASWYKSFLTVSGLSQYNGTTVGVCTDGGFLEAVTLNGGAITFSEQTCSMVLGYMYTGIIKTFCLGFQYQGQNTQTTVKGIVQVGVRTVASAGGKIGSDRYNLEDVQELSQSDLNYLPPLPIDGTKFVDYTDDAQEDKYLYFVQDEPLPFQITNLMLRGNYALTP